MRTKPTPQKITAQKLPKRVNPETGEEVKPIKIKNGHVIARINVNKIRKG